MTDTGEYRILEGMTYRTVLFKVPVREHADLAELGDADDAKQWARREFALEDLLGALHKASRPGAPAPASASASAEPEPAACS